MVAVTPPTGRSSSPPLAPSFWSVTSFRALSSWCLWLLSGWQWIRICSSAREATKCPDFRKLPFVPPFPLQILHRNENVSTVADPIASLLISSWMTSKSARGRRGTASQPRCRIRCWGGRADANSLRGGLHSFRRTGCCPARMRGPKGRLGASPRGPRCPRSGHPRS
jgi:hypothetical protein